VVEVLDRMYFNMKIDELKKALKHLIREEVKKVVADEVNKAMGKVLVEMVKEIKANNNSPTIVEEVEHSTIINTKNPKLNSVLAETTRHFKPLPKTADMVTGLAELMDGGFDKVGQGEDIGIKEKPSSNMEFLKQMVAQSPQPMNQPSVLDGGSGIPDALKKVFKKDFRAIMKKIDEQKNGGGGYIDPSKVLSG